MHAQGYLAKPQHSPTSFALAFAVTGVGLGALLLTNPYVRSVIADGPLIVENVNLPKPPPPKPTPPVKTPQAHSAIETLVPPPPQFTAPKPIIDSPPIDLTGLTGSGTNDFVRIPAIPPIETIVAKPPVLSVARPDPRFARDQQPPYPPALQREEIEGAVTVRVRIGPDGRVLAVEAVHTDHEGFLSATREWAIRHWRFLPAMRDGTPVESWRTMTVRFNIERN